MRTRNLTLCAMAALLLIAGLAYVGLPSQSAEAAPANPCYSCYFSGFAVGLGSTLSQATANATAYAQSQCNACNISTSNVQKVYIYGLGWQFQVTVSYGCLQCIT